MNPRRPLLAALLLLAPLAAQDPATSLFAALQAADAVVTARVTAATDPSPDWHRLQFAVTGVQKGAVPAAFTMLEPAGACCGRSLFALQVGDERLLFLRRQGATWHPFGGARGVLPVSPEVLAHVVALQAAGDAAGQAQVLCGALASPDVRIADDAAAALAVLPRLQGTAGSRAAITSALQQAAALGLVRGAHLVEAAVRVADDTTVDTLLTTYLGTPRDDFAALLRRGLVRCDAGRVTTRLPQWVRDDAKALRAAQLLVELPAEHAGPALAQLLRPGTHPRVVLCIAEGLLAAGARGEDLARSVPAPVLQLAEQRQRRPDRFRAIDPDRR